MPSQGLSTLKGYAVEDVHFRRDETRFVKEHIAIKGEARPENFTEVRARQGSLLPCSWANGTGFGGTEPLPRS